MKIRNITFPSVFAASGSLNFFGEGWWYHKFFQLIFPGFSKLKSECAFVSKTTTLEFREGNMPLHANMQPKSLFPDCIKLYPRKGVVLNAVGLSGPGAKALFGAGIWQKRKTPFFISFMAVGNTAAERLKETRAFVELFKEELPKFSTSVGVQANMSCPNTKHDTTELAKEALETIEILSELNIPIDLKVNVLFSNELVKEIEKQGLCDVITVSNTIPYGTCQEYLDWQKLFSTPKSPLDQYGGGGLSGSAIKKIVRDKIYSMRQDGVTIPIKGSGGIMSRIDVVMMKEVGADAIEFATAAMIRPWRVGSIIKNAHRVFN